jgi:hypothetical protein
LQVVMDPVTRMPKGFGFVRFTVKEEADQALQTMNGVFCSSRPMRVSVATDRNSRPRSVVGGAMVGPMGGAMAYGGPVPEEEGTNTTVFVGGLDASTTDEDLRAHFAPVGEIVSVKVPPGRGCGFVQYASKDAAEVAIAQMNGTVVNGAKVRCAWGRSAAARAAASSSNGTAAYYQQYGYGQQYGQSYYGYGAGYYQQYPQQGATAGYAQGYGAYAQGYAQGQQPQAAYAPHGHYGGHHGRQQHQQDGAPTRDFTRPDDLDGMNRRYASQRAYQVRSPP